MTLRPTALAATLVLLAAPASAQLRLATASPEASPEVVSEIHHVCTLYDHGDHARPGPALDLAAVETARRGVTYERVVSRQPQATFIVDYADTFTPEARAAFQRAVDIWGAHLVSSVPIRVRADFAALDPCQPQEPCVLGSAGPRIAGLTDGISVTWFPFALADALLEEDVAPPDEDGQNYDIEARFNSAFQGFYFGLDGNPPSNRIDFVTTVLHELGHGLAFIGSGEVDDGAGSAECTGEENIGCVGITARSGETYPLVFDTFLTNGVFESILDESTYPNNSFRLGGLFRSQDLLVNSPTVARIYGGLTPVWAPAEFKPGSSFSHWDEDVIENSSAAMMTPALARGEAYQDPGDITCAFFADMGWTLGPGCQTLGVAEEPALVAAGAALEMAGPNPTRGATTVRLRQSAPGDARVTLHDALGRRLATLLDGAARTEETLAVGAEGLAPGVYHVVARTAEGTVARALTVVR